jgi:hypothetical protein
MWDDFFGGGHDWAIIFPLSEDMAQENGERDKARRDIFGEDYSEFEGFDADMDDDFET